MKNKVLYLLLFLSNIALAQRPNSFSFDPNVFIEEFEIYMKSGNSNIKQMAEEFSGYYNAGKFNQAQKLQIIKLCNQMLNSNCQLTPDFEGYLKTINALVTNNFMPKFDGWHKTLSAALSTSKENFQKFLNVSKNVFAENILLKVGGFTWITDAKDVDLIVEKEPLFLFKKLNLYCFTPGDTFDIINTSGRFFPASNHWVGKGGKVDWSRVGIDTSKVFAMLGNYKIDLSDGNLEADSALFTNKELNAKPLLGKLIDKPLGQSQGDKSTYPQFESYYNAFAGVTYGKAKFMGGFGMRGALVQGKGTTENKAELWFSFKNKPFLRVKSVEFFVRESKITVNKAEVTIFLDKDSIYHPQLSFTYYINEDKINLYRDNKLGIASAPFIDYYHNLEFYVDEIKWDLNSPKIIFDNIAGDRPAKFESINYFRDHIYEKIGGMLDYNPLQRIKTYCENNKTKSFHIESYAKAFKSNKSDIKIQMIDLNDKGFVTYNPETEKVVIKQKLIDYVNAHHGRTDYDAISFNSIISSLPNAHLSLINYDLVIQGVPVFAFSDSQNVKIIPKDQVITIKKNRGMDFSGKLKAGMVDFYGNNFSFDYNSFKIRLNNIDSLKFLYYDDSLQQIMHAKSVLQNVYGTLEIDYPYNKSSRRKYPGYPIFTSDVGSKVFYDYPTTQKGVYDRRRFYFDVDPFTIDSLSELNLYTLNLAGNFVSGGILPEFKHEIYMQPDKSLGFYIPNDSTKSYTLYGGKGSAKMGLSLSNKGLIGDGTLSYLASKTHSTEFVFLLDSMNSNSYMFENDRTSLFPTIIKSKNVYNHWIPYQDTMFITNKGEPIQVAYDRARLSGTIILTPKAMKAKGKFDIEDGELLADLYELKPAEILSDDAIFRQRHPRDTTQIAFETGKVKAYVNLDTKIADFTYNNYPAINNTFILNNYVGQFKQLRWNMIPRTLEFKGPSEKQQPGAASYLLSTRPSQDSLKFNTTNVMLALGDYVMKCEGIPFITIADSRVMPDSGKAVIRENAEMDMLFNAKIQSDTINKYHRLDKVTIKINGRTDCRGAGNYYYLDKNKKEQVFYMEEIYVANKKHLEGKSLIPDSINFHVGPKLGFRGNTFFKSPDKNLEYNGFFKAEHEMPYPRTDWFRAASPINPDSIFILVGQPLTNLARQALHNGFFISNDSTHVYPAFFSRKRNTSDPELIKAEGVLTFNDKFEEFQLGSTEKIYNISKKGNFMAFNIPKKTVYAEGKFNLGFNTEGFKINSAGYASFSLADTTFGMRQLMTIDMLLPDAALKIMYDSINENSAKASNQFYDNKVLRIGMHELVDEKTEKKLSETIGDELSGKNIEQLQKSFLITDVVLAWSQPTRSLISVGEIGIRSMDKFLVERKVRAKIEILKKRSGDEFTFYIEPMEGGWYYFKYQRGVMAVLASDPIFNEIIKNGSDKISKQKEDYKLRQASIAERNKFARAMKGK
ncbi:MAG: hypothetical protein ACK4K9_05190 [Bacteroidia bacterium]